MHPEILSRKQSDILPALAHAVAGTDLYMAGGTALALQIGHRHSIDFDWFTPAIGNADNFLLRLTDTGLPYTVLSISHETIYININEVQVSFIGYDYPLLRPTVPWADYHLDLAHLADIAAMKLSAITSRGSKKDFIDLFFITRDHFPLGECLKLFIKKYRQRDIGHVLRSLVYFEDAEEEPEVKTQIPTSWPHIKKEFETQVKGLVKSILEE